MMLPIAAHAQWWSQHPGYMRCINDLHTAAWLIEHRDPGDRAQADEERRALDTIGGTVRELEAAASADGMRFPDRPPPNFVWPDRHGRLQQALQLLHRAHDEISAEEDNPAARGLRDRASLHIVDAARWTEAAARY
jgi:hypothetical protein